MIPFIKNLSQYYLLKKPSLLKLPPQSSRRHYDKVLEVIDPRAKPKVTKKQSKHRKQGNASSYKFVDTTRIKVKGGSGGKGCLSFESMYGSTYKKRPDGGHGGNGGVVVIMADANEQSLNMSTHHFKAQDGTNGSSRQMHGRNGKDKIIRVPCGVVVKRVLEYDEIWDEETGEIRRISIDDGNDDLYQNDEDVSYRFQTEFSDDDESNIDHSEFILDENDFNQTNEEREVEQHTETNATQYENNKNKNKTKYTRPYDFDEKVNTGIKSEDDGLYHWDQERDNSDFLGMGYGMNEDEDSISSSSDMHHLEREKVTVADLDKPGSYVVVANGGRGGVGNSAYAKQQFRPQLLSKAAEKSSGIPGEEVFLELELKLIADIGLVGFPNAGKSSLLAAMSKARPEIAPYPFTTLNPLVGCVEYRDGFRAVLADVPGLIDGAAEGRGRGHAFLKHLERTKALLYIVDAAGVDGRDPLNDLSTLVDEIESYGDGDMMTRPALVVANKLDLIPDEDMRNEIYIAMNDVANEKGVRFDEVLGISAGVSGEGLSELSKSIRSLVELGDQFRLETNASSESYV